MPTPRTAPRWVRAAAGLGVTVLCAIVAPPAAGADPPRRPRASIAISPSRLEIPGAELGAAHSFQVTNRGSAPMDVTVGVRDFVARENGTVAFRDAAPYSASHWVSAAPAHLTLPAGAAARVRVRIRVPTDAEPGDHQVVVVFMAQPQGRVPGIRISKGVGAPVVFTLPGATDPTVRVLGLRAPRFALAGPLRFTATLQSTGTVHRTFSDAHRLAVEVNGGRVTFPDFMVLRGATRTVATTWRDPPLACFCRASVALRLPDGTVSRISVPVTVLPLHLIVIAAAGAVGIWLAVRLRRRRYRDDVLAAARTLSRADDD